MSSCDRQQNIEDPIKDASKFDCKKNFGHALTITIKGASNSDRKKNIGDGLIITTVAATTVGIFFALRVVNVEQTVIYQTSIYGGAMLAVSAHVK